MTELQVLKDNIRVLLKLEYGTEIIIKEDYKLLWYLCNNNKKELIEDLIKAGFDINIKNDLGNTALIWAVYYEHFEIIKLLLENGADVNTKNKFHHSALFWAIKKKRLVIIKLLNKYGAKE